MTPTSAERIILRVSCTDSIGIVADIAGFLAERRLFIVETSNFGDPKSGRFFLRVVFSPEGQAFSEAAFRDEFAKVAARWNMTWEARNARDKPNVLILVSQQDHCLNDLLYRHRIGALAMNVAGIVSNHQTCAWLAERHNLPFFRIPSARDEPAAAEAGILDVASATQADLVVLARYMQILSPRTCQELMGRCINIHHSFLPGFKGAAPYTQAFERGVKLIGATAHYVTPDLDEGPIIAQAVEPADHAHTPEMLSAVGRDIEARVLAAAVSLHIDGRIFLNGSKTVVLK